MLTLKEMEKVQNNASPSDMRKWVFDKMENTEMMHGAMKAAFKRKFGDRNLKHFERFVSDFMGD